MLFALTGFSLVANAIQVISSGFWWAWSALIFIVIFLLLLTLVVRPLFRRTSRKSVLVESLRRAGLVDIEHRGDPAYRITPHEVISKADGPVLITGILDQLFQQQREAILRFADEGHVLRVLLIHPTEVASALGRSWAGRNPAWLSYWRTNCNEALTALDAIIEADLHRHPRVHVRFMTELPPYFGILVGDPSASNLTRRRPYVRIQPLTVSRFVGKGTVMTFERTHDSNQTPFAYFSEDLDAQWGAATDGRVLIEERVATLQLPRQ
jgi:hypothetical protein